MRIRVVAAEDAKPIARASVNVSAYVGSRERKANYTVDDQGECAAVLPSSNLQALRIRCQAEGRVPMTVRWDSVTFASLLQEFTFPMEVGTTIGGVIRNEDGEPIGRAGKEFAVAEMEGGRSDEPQDLGTLDVEMYKYLKVGDTAPAFEVPTLDGRTLKLADLRGKYVLLDFWATWCGPCRGETPHLKSAYEKFGKDPRFVIVSLSLDAEQKEPRDYAKKEPMDWPQGFLGDWSKAKLPNEYGVRGIPAIFLIGPDGKIIAKDLRGPAILSAVEKALGDGGTTTRPAD